MGILKSHAGGKYLRSDDIDGTGKEFGIVATIVAFSEADVSRQDDEKSEIKPIVHFEPDDELKPLVCNATNLDTLISLWGDDEEKIVGKEIGIYVDPRVKYQGKNVKGLRLCDHREIGEKKSQ